MAICIHTKDSSGLLNVLKNMVKADKETQMNRLPWDVENRGYFVHLPVSDAKAHLKPEVLKDELRFNFSTKNYIDHKTNNILAAYHARFLEMLLHNFRGIFSHCTVS